MCQNLDNLGWAVNNADCRACITAECCEPFETCASNNTCIEAWNCIAAEPCPDKWPQCPGAVESVIPLDGISQCTEGPCAEVCTLPCLPQIAACDAEPECVALEICLVACLDTCNGDTECLTACSDDCDIAPPEIVELWNAKVECQYPSCG